jgi:hypothetical protein
MDTTRLSDQLVIELIEVSARKMPSITDGLRFIVAAELFLY